MYICGMHGKNFPADFKMFRLIAESDVIFNTFGDEAYHYTSYISL